MIYYEYTRSNSWHDGTIVRRKLGKGSICYSPITYDSGEWQDSREIFPAVLKLFENEKIGEMKAANRIKPVYLLDVNNLKIAFYLSEIGASPKDYIQIKNAEVMENIF